MGSIYSDFQSCVNFLKTELSPADVRGTTAIMVRPRPPACRKKRLMPVTAESHGPPEVLLPAFPLPLSQPSGPAAQRGARQPLLRRRHCGRGRGLV